MHAFYFCAKGKTYILGNSRGYLIPISTASIDGQSGSPLFGQFLKILITFLAHFDPLSDVAHCSVLCVNNKRERIEIESKAVVQSGTVRPQTFFT
jgi:hypothetical protein